MGQAKQQDSWHNPNLVIDCVLANAGRRLEADGCVLELSGENSKLTSPSELSPGDFVKVRLWVENDENFIDIRLAEVKNVDHHWITVDVILVNQEDRKRLKQLVDAAAGANNIESAPIDHLLIRA